MRKNNDKKSINTARIRSEIGANSFERSKLFKTIYDGEVIKLEDGENNVSPVQLVARTILFTSAHSLLSESKWIFFLINSIITGRVIIKHCPVGFYIDIYELNDNLEPIKLDHPKRCFLEPVSMAAIAHLQKCIKAKPQKAFSSQSNLYQTLFTLHIKEPLVKLGSLKMFCEAAADYASQSLYLTLPMYLASYAKGKVRSFSTNPLSFSRLWSNKPSEKLSLGNIDEIDTDSFYIEKIGVSNTETSYSSGSDHPTDATYSRLLSRCQSKVRGEVALVETQIDRLERYLNSLKAASEVILAEWLLSLLKKDRKVETAKRYLSAVGKYWLQNLHGVAIHEMSEIEMTDFRDGINDLPGSGESNANREATLNRLLKFSNINFNTVLPSLPDDDPEKYNLPRNFVICEHDFQHLLVWIRSQYSRGQQRIDSLYIATLLMGRCGLRPTEVLSLLMAEVEPSEQLQIFIRASRFGRIKTDSAKRKIPIHILLKPDEFEFFKQYYEKRKTQQEMDLKNPLLLPPDISRNYTYSVSDFDIKISQKLTEICGQRVVTYNLRHTALSNVQLAVLSLEATSVEGLSPYSTTEAGEIRRYFTKNSDKDGCWNISGLAGHLVPSTTFGVYMHFTDILISEYIQKNDQRYSRTFWQNLSGFSSTFFTRNKLTDNASAKEFMPLLANKLNLKEAHQKTYEYNGNREDSTARSARKLTYQDCISALRLIDKGQAIESISLALDIPKNDIFKWHKNATALRGIVSSKGKPRLFPSTSKGKSKQPASDQKRLNPIPPTYRGEIKRAHKILTKFRHIYLDQKLDIHWFVQYTINHVTPGHAYIDFSCKSVFQRYIKVASMVTKGSDWEAEFTPLQKTKKIQSKWQVTGFSFTITQANSVVKNANLFPDGSLRLFFINRHNKPQSANQRYSSNVIKYVCHVLAISCGII